MSLEKLVEISRYYGKNPDYVLAGGGNTSWKDNTLYIKASGSSLAEVTAGSFVKMDRKALARIWDKKYPESNDERESAVLADMMAARMPGEEQKRPSVEALLHDILPFNFVAHFHPAVVNGLLCSQRGEQAMREIFGDAPIWIPSTNPGYILSRLVKTAMDAYSEKNARPASVIFQQNHGVFAGADDVDGIKKLYDEMMSKIGARITREPNFSGVKLESPAAAVSGPTGEIARTLAKLAGASAFMSGGEISAMIKDRASFAPVASAFSPDHIVYAGSNPLFTAAQTEEGILVAWKDHTEKIGINPKIIAVQELGVFGAAATEKAANLALELFKDSCKVAVYSESFGGPLFMTQEQIDFINNWEVERFRSSVSTK